MGSHIDATIAAAAGLGVALIGGAVNLLLFFLSRRHSSESEDDAVTALAQALAAEVEARKAAEQRAADCEKRWRRRRA